MFEPLTLDIEVNSEGVVFVTSNKLLLKPQEFSLNRTFLNSVFDFSLDYYPRGEDESSFDNLQSLNDQMEILEWTEDGVKFQLEFEDPLEISIMRVKDILRMKVKKP